MIFYLKSFRSVLLAMGIIAIIELIIGVNGYNGYISDPVKLLNLEYLKDVPTEKFHIIGKINYLKGRDIDFVSVGDSSGMFSLNPLVIEKNLDGMSFYNGNVQQPIGVPGYRHMAEIFLKNNNIKYLVYHTSIFNVRSDNSWWVGWSPYIYKSYLSFFSFILDFPSSEYRIFVTNLFYYFGKDKMKIMGHLLSNAENHSGFFAVDLEGGKPVGECDFAGWNDERGNSILNRELQKVKDLTDEYGVKLVVIFGPVSCKAGEKIKPLLIDLEKFQKNNPDVFIPLGLINHLDVKHFGDGIHIKSKSTSYYSDIIGRILKDKVIHD